MKSFLPIILIVFFGALPASAEKLDELLDQSGTHVVLDLDIPLSVLAPLVETLVPLTFSDTINDPAGGAIKDDRITISAQRGSIILSVDEGRLRAHTTATGRANFTGDLLFDDISETLDIRAVAVVFGDARIRDDWSLELDLSGDASLREAEMRILGIKISLRSLFQDRIDTSIERGLNRLRQQTNTPGYLRNAAGDLWSNACEDLDIGDLRLRIQPIQIAVSQPTFEAGAISFQILVSTEIVPSDGAVDCPELPETLLLLD